MSRRKDLAAQRKALAATANRNRLASEVDRANRAEQLAAHHETRHADARKLLESSERTRTDMLLACRRMKAMWTQRLAFHQSEASANRNYLYNMGQAEQLKACLADLDEVFRV